MKKILNNKWNYLAIIFIAIIIVAGIIYIFNKPQAVEAGWFDDSWAYRQSVPISNGGSAQTDYQIKIILDAATLITAGKMQSDCDDIRITGISGNILNYWIEENTCNTSSADIWVKVGNINVGTSATVLYIYYGNSSAAGISNMDNIFDTNIAQSWEFNTDGDLEGWSSRGNLDTPVVSNGVWSANTTASDGYVYSPTGLTINASTSKYIFVKYRVTAGRTNDGFFWKTNLDDTWSETKHYVAVHGFTGNWEVVAHRISDDAQWTNTVTALRMDTTNSHPSSIEVDWIRIQDSGSSLPVVSTPASEEKGPGPVGYWKFDEGYGTTTYDSSVNSNYIRNATGGTITEVDGYRIHTFTSGGTFTPTTSGNVEVLVVAGGGGGGGSHGGGGGGGGVIYNSSYSVNGGEAITTTVGAGASGRIGNGQGNDGGNSVFGLITSIGGGGGGYETASGRSGGSGGGGGGKTLGGASGTTNQGYAGGDGSNSSGYGAGGGGGASEVGVATTNNNGGNGGDGYLSSISGSSVYYGGGGGGASYSGGTAGVGGSGGGGDGTLYSGQHDDCAPHNGTPNTGGGGGGCYRLDGLTTGGSGIVIIRYPIVNDGTISGATWQTEDVCVSGKCLFFDGIDDSVQLEREIFIADTTIYSISAWFKIVGSKSSNMLFGNNTDSSDYLLISPTGANHKNTSDSYSYVAYNYDDGNWHQIVLVRNGTIDVDHYVDGLYVNDDNLDNNATFNIDEFGRYFNSNNATYNFKGFIDEIKTYNYPRTAAQISADYLAGQSGLTGGVSAGFGGKSSANRSLSEGLVGYWKLDELSSTAVDYSGNSNSGTWVGTANDVVGKYGNAISLDGNSDYISISDSSSLDITPDITLSVWVKFTNVTANYQNIIAKRGAASTPLNYFLRTGGSNDTDPDEIQFGYYNDGYHIVGTTTANLVANTWYHIVATHTDSQEKIYINGSEYSTTWRWGSSSAALIINDDLLAIGRGGNYAAEYTGGQIDEVRIYNRELSAAEVSDLYNWAPGPVVHYTFEEGSGTTINDMSSNNNNGITQGSPTWSIGKYGKAIELSDSKYVQVPYVSAFNQKDFTITTWIKWDDQSVSRVFFSCGDSALLNRYLHLIRRANNQVAFGFFQDDYNDIFSTTAGLWYHLGFIYNATTNIQSVYVNGALVGTRTATADLQVTSGAAAGGYCEISRYNGGLNHDGLVDDFKIYNYTRTAKQIVSDMNAGHPAGGSPVASQLGYWKFDEGYGDIAYDSGFGDNDGNLEGSCPGAITCPSWSTDGVVGRSLSFDGGDEIALSSSIAGLGTGTVSAWIKVPNGTNHRGAILGWGDGGTANWGSFEIGPSTGAYDNEYMTYVNQGANALTVMLRDMDTNNSYLLEDGSWHHLVAVVDGIENTFYIDGVKQDVIYQAGTATTSNSFLNSNSNTILRIGDSTYNGGHIPFQGKIDEVKIYNYGLTADEVLIDMNQGASSVMGNLGTDSSGNVDNSVSRSYCVPGDTSTCNPPIAHWNFEDSGQTTYLYDKVGTNNGTLAGSMTSDDWVRGKVGRGLEIHNSQGALLASTIYLADTSNWTVSGWMKTNSANMETMISNASSGPVYNLLGMGSGKILYYHYDGAWRSKYGTSTINDNQWHFLTWVNHSNQTIDMYVDGIAEAMGIVAVENSNGPVNQIGRYWGSAANVSLDEIKYFNYIRTPEQIAWDFNRGAPVGWWKFDECEGSTAYDWAPSGEGYRGNDATITIAGTGSQTAVGTCETSGTAWYNGATGQRNGSINLDGTDDYVQVGGDDTFKYITEGSVSVWFKMPDLVQSNHLFSVGPKTTLSTGLWFWFVVNNDGSITTRQRNVDGSEVLFASTSAGVIVANTWYNAIWTVNSSGNVLYLNGIRQNLTYTSGSASTAYFFDDIATTQNYWIGGGKYNSATVNRYGYGKIDDVRIYNYALTQEQVSAVMNDGAVSF